ncbi:unnamed protein product [Paramecium sonneborni]|uniref:Uncharacterized protein n=1 Tax=Paramecium sonneborni TaxID=65129 RepID=A0A8S1RRP4_9CILI|nr:unnamed protein product [Paramecium sonneborni]
MKLQQISKINSIFNGLQRTEFNQRSSCYFQLMIKLLEHYMIVMLLNNYLNNVNQTREGRPIQEDFTQVIIQQKKQLRKKQIKQYLQQSREESNEYHNQHESYNVFNNKIIINLIHRKQIEILNQQQ